MIAPGRRLPWLGAALAAALLLAFALRASHTRGGKERAAVHRPSLTLPAVTHEQPMHPPHEVPPVATRMPPPYEPAPLEPAHPIREEHERLGLVHRLLGALHDALDLGDHAGMRDLLERYDEAEPEDPQQLREGFERIADCLAAQDATARADARANAQRYYDQARASTLRRYIRRHCLSL